MVFFAVSYFYFGFFLNYIFFYQEKASLFILSSDFLIENLHQPGGFLIWLGKLLSAFYYYPFAGAFIISGIITLIVVAISKIIKIVIGRDGIALPLLVGILLFYLQTDYRFLLFNNLGLLLQLALFYIVIRNVAFLKGWFPVLLAPLWYYATGSYAFVFYVLFTCYLAIEQGKQGWLRILALWCLNLIVFFVSKEYLFYQPGTTLLMFPFSVINAGSQLAIVILVVSLISFIPLICLIKPGHLKSGIRRFPVILISVIFLIIALSLIGIKRIDRKTKQYFLVEKLFYQNKFKEIIAFNLSNPTTNSLTIYLNNIALCEEDQLDDLLFHFPQDREGKTLFLNWKMTGEILNRGGYFYYTIGMINEANRWAFENMVMKGYSPEGLKMLIRTELINANYRTASKYVTLLKKSLFYKKDAAAFEKMLFNDAAVNADRELGQKRQTMVKNDFFTLTDNPSLNLETILLTDPLNKKAFEYRTAFLLLTKNFTAIIHDLPRFEKLGFSKLPVHVEEAALAISVSNKGLLPDIGNLGIRNSTGTQWNQYLTVLHEYGNNVKSAEPALRRLFGNSYWYYVFYK